MIKTKQQANPFQGPLSQPAQTVGRTYGERRLGQAGMQPAQTVARKPVDQFSPSGKKASEIATFDPKATYKAARKFSNGAPYRPAIINHLQNGTAPQKTSSEVKRPSNNACLNFLAKVINDPTLHSAQAIRKAAFHGAPVKRS
ncbi:MAG: hypothetical protein V2A66_05320 [Pseudomonadota bacterium]